MAEAERQVNFSKKRGMRREQRGKEPEAQKQKVIQRYFPNMRKIRLQTEK